MGILRIKKTNEIKMLGPLLENIDISNRDITLDALHTQKEEAKLIVDKKAHYHFTVKRNQPTLHDDIALLFEQLQEKPDYEESTCGEHGRIETRKIWVSDELNTYVNFPHVGQVYKIERVRVQKKSGKESREIVYCITSRSISEISAKRLLEINRGHWSIENRCHWILDWNYNEDRCTIRTGYGPENISRLRRFAVGLLLSKKSGVSVAEKFRELASNVRAVMDYLKMTKNAQKQIPVAARN